jgi:D-aspartate ligase
MPTVFSEIIAGRMTLSEYFRSLRGKKEFAVFSLKDPFPFIMEFMMIPYLWVKRGF